MKSTTRPEEYLNAIKRALADFQRAATIHFKKMVRAVRSAIARFVARPTLPFGPLSTPYVNAVLSRICNDDPETLIWVLRWIAYPLRNPGAKMSTALWIGGGQGTGKSLIFGKLFGTMHRDRFRTIGGSVIRNQFNPWASEQRYVLVEDSDMALAANVKHLITSKIIPIRAKGYHPRYEYNEMNFVFLSSDFDALPDVDASDRRFMVIEPGRRLDSSHYQAANDELRCGGAEQFYQFLMRQLDMGDFNEFTLPAKGAN